MIKFAIQDIVLLLIVMITHLKIVIVGLAVVKASYVLMFVLVVDVPVMLYLLILI